MRLVALLAVAVAILAAGVLAAARGTESATAASSGTLVIRPGVGIARIRLGMSEAQVRRAMGRPRLVSVRSAAFGRRAIEYEYGLGAYHVRFLGPAGRRRAVRIGTSLLRERTPKGVGVGSTERAVMRAYPTLRCQPLETERHGSVRLVVTIQRECTLFAGSGRRTIFSSDVRERMFEVITPEMWRRLARVVEVTVAAAA